LIYLSIDISRIWRHAMSLKSFATVALILIPSLAFAAGGGGGTGASNAGNGNPGGANGDASNGNTPVDSAGAYVGKGASYRAGKNGDSGSMGASKEMKRQNREPQKAP
jgi:hypothetical protein